MTISPAHPFLIQVDEFEKNRCYFNSFDSSNDLNRETDHVGIARYTLSWVGEILRLLGWAVKLRDSTQKVYYLNKNSLVNWLSRHEAPLEGSYYERIAEVCKQSYLKEARRTFTSSVFQEGHLAHVRERKNLKEKLIPALRKNVQIKKAYRVIQPVVHNYIERLRLKKREQRLEDKQFQINFGSEKLIANPERMQTAGHYFSCLLNYKEGQEFLVNLELDNDIEIEGEAFNFIKTYLEGPLHYNRKEQRYSSVKEDLAPLLNATYLPTLYKNLYQLHQHMDISGILEVVREHIDLYTDEPLTWKEETPLKNVLPPSIFWLQRSLTSQEREAQIENIVSEALMADPMHMVYRKRQQIQKEQDNINLTRQELRLLRGQSLKPVNFWKKMAGYLNDPVLAYFCEEKFKNLNKLKALIEAVKRQEEQKILAPSVIDWFNEGCRVNCKAINDNTNSLIFNFFENSEYSSVMQSDTFYYKKHFEILKFLDKNNSPLGTFLSKDLSSFEINLEALNSLTTEKIHILYDFSLFLRNKLNCPLIIRNYSRQVDRSELHKNCLKNLLEHFPEVRFEGIKEVPFVELKDLLDHFSIEGYDLHCTSSQITDHPRKDCCLNLSISWTKTEKSPSCRTLQIKNITASQINLEKFPPTTLLELEPKQENRKLNLGNFLSNFYGAFPQHLKILNATLNVFSINYLLTYFSGDLTLEGCDFEEKEMYEQMIIDYMAMNPEKTLMVL